MNLKKMDKPLIASYKKLQAKAQILALDMGSTGEWVNLKQRSYILDQALHLLTAPIIWSGLIPAVLMDLFVTVYQKLCFPVYKIKPVKRSDFVVFDREQLAFLSLKERINCLYCSYFNGVAAYTREVAARTERYWCPLKHLKEPKQPHPLYRQFADFGDEENFRRKLN
jgi:hypothetical protein